MTDRLVAAQAILRDRQLLPIGHAHGSVLCRCVSLIEIIAPLGELPPPNVDVLEGDEASMVLELAEVVGMPIPLLTPAARGPGTLPRG
jgi:hypothetical protein